MITEPLGEKLHITALKLRGTLSVEAMAGVLEEVVSISGMTTAGMKPAIWTYPLDGGAGGLGNTIFQPLVESFLISDDWPDLGHTFIVFASCRRYSIQAIMSYLAFVVGPVDSLKVIEL